MREVKLKNIAIIGHFNYRHKLVDHTKLFLPIYYIYVRSSLMAGALGCGPFKATLPKCLIFVKLASFKFHRLRPGRLLCSRCVLSRFSVGATFKATLRCLTKHLFHIVISIVIAELVSKSTLACFPLYVLVDACCSAVSEERLIVEVVVFVIAKALCKASCLIEQTLIVHCITSRRLSLTKSDFL